MSDEQRGITHSLHTTVYLCLVNDSKEENENKDFSDKVLILWYTNSSLKNKE